MEKQFGCIPYTTYQAGETGRIGFQCERRRGFHLNVDAVPVRLVDENGRTVGPGEVGEVVVSNLYNRAMVLLNYRVGDLGALSTIPCPCGRSLPLLAGFEGRCTEVLQLPDGRKIPYVMFEVLLKNELHDSIQAQMVQSTPARILLADRPCFKRRPRETACADPGEILIFHWSEDTGNRRICRTHPEHRRRKV